MQIVGSIDVMGTIAIGAGLWMLWKRHVIGAPRIPRGETYRQYDDRQPDTGSAPRLDAGHDLAARRQSMLDAERRNALELAEEIERLRDPQTTTEKA